MRGDYGGDSPLLIFDVQIWYGMVKFGRVGTLSRLDRFKILRGRLRKRMLYYIVFCGGGSPSQVNVVLYCVLWGGSPSQANVVLYFVLLRYDRMAL